MYNFVNLLCKPKGRSSWTRVYVWRTAAVSAAGIQMSIWDGRSWLCSCHTDKCPLLTDGCPSHTDTCPPLVDTPRARTQLLSTCYVNLKIWQKWNLDVIRLKTKRRSYRLPLFSAPLTTLCISTSLSLASACVFVRMLNAVFAPSRWILRPVPVTSA